MRKKPEKKTPQRICLDCDHLYACQAWTGAGHLMNTDATHCANYQTVDVLHRQIIVSREIIDEQNAEIDRLESRVKELESTQQRWISVKDDLPEDDKWVVCWYRDTHGCYYPTAGMHTQHGWETDMNDDNGYPVEEITHWMPLFPPQNATP